MPTPMPTCPLAQSAAIALRAGYRAGSYISSAEQVAVVGIVEMFCLHLDDLPPHVRSEFATRYGHEAWSVVIDQWESMTAK